MKANFREAAKHEQELNDRQREVLALVAQGLTNAEIGERLGMSLDGAKWNVSEILSKLGLASREEAAEYWRWRHGGVWSRVRALMGAPLAKVVGAGAMAVVGVVVVAALVSEDEPPAEEAPGRPFYLEAEVAATTETAETVRTTLRWWWRDDQHMRFEDEVTDPDGTVRRSVLVRDGRSQWNLWIDQSSYREAPVPGGPLQIPISLGRLPLEGGAASLDDVIAWLDSTHKGNSRTQVVRKDRLLGRSVTVLQHDSDGPVEVWIDRSSLLVLKLVSDKAGESRIEATVTRLDYDVELDDSLFQFEPPPGVAKQEVDTSWFGPRGEAGLDDEPPQRFFKVELGPGGYRFFGARMGTTHVGDVLSYEILFLSENGGQLLVLQRKGEMADSSRTGEMVSVRGNTAWMSRNDRGWTQVAWEEAGLTIVISADALSVEELLALAASIRFVE
ncbi:MAG TPA: helix-turn-helix transcriptional regulator [Tepidiformaceae bacterium]|nr:helix-turn-helix transcriptional regulator [Tepidiformaceae bacterium]